MSSGADPLAGVAAQRFARSLVEIRTDSVAWRVLYVDPATGLLWQESYPQSESHGGGSPLLEVINRADALARFDVEEEDLDPRQGFADGCQ